MAEVILMPRLSDTMTEGVIAAWHKKVGDTVKKGDLLAEIETDKATMELESYQDGTLLHLGAKTGEKLQVNDLLAIIGKSGEDVTALIAQHQNNENTQQPTTEKPLEAKKNEPSVSAATVNMDDAVLMPRLSDTMTEGVIAAWHKKVGDNVVKGDVLAEIETDKATMDLESYKSGKLLYVGAKEGEKIAVNDLLCIIGKEGTDVNSLVNAIQSNPGAKNVAADSAPKTTEDLQKAEGDTAPANLQVQNAKDSSPGTQPIVDEGRVIASPLAKKLAQEKGVDIRTIKGSGDNGRIVKRDVDEYKPAAQTQQSRTQTGSTPAVAGQISFEEIPVSQMRKTIARRLAESKFSAPHFYLTMSIDMDAAVAARGRLNEVSKVKISFNDMIVKAVAVALQQHPKVNSSWLGDKIRINHHVNIGIAVAVDEGLLVPVVRFADNKTLSQIAVEVKDFAQKAKDKKLQPSDWEGSTFTISNLGMFGIDQFTAIINPPDACILAIGAINQIPVVKDGQVQPGNIMKVTLSCDHRAVDGATGAAFLQTLKGLLEEPLRMLI